MNDQVTKKEYHAAIRTLRDSYKHGELSNKSFRELVKLVGSAYYGQKMDKMIKKYIGG